MRMLPPQGEAPERGNKKAALLPRRLYLEPFWTEISGR